MRNPTRVQEPPAVIAIPDSRRNSPMYKPKPTLTCAMPARDPLRVLVLSGTLKHAPEISNTCELTDLVLEAMRQHAPIHADVIRLCDRHIPVGLGFRESADDDWPEIVG